MKRIFVGGLFPEVTEDDIQKRFEHFGEVSGVEIKKKTSDAGIVVRYFYFENELYQTHVLTLQDDFSPFDRTKFKSILL